MGQSLGLQRTKAVPRSSYFIQYVEEGDLQTEFLGSSQKNNNMCDRD